MTGNVEEPTKEQWKARIKQGRNMAAKCRMIANEAYTQYHAKKHGGYRIYEERLDNGDFLKISLDTYAYNMDVYFNGIRVLDVHLGDLDRFIPNPSWMQRVIDLYIPLKAAKEAEEKRKKDQEKREHLAKWGF